MHPVCAGARGRAGRAQPAGEPVLGAAPGACLPNEAAAAGPGQGGWPGTALR